MKKIFVAIMAIAAVAFSSCTNFSEKTEETVCDSTEVCEEVNEEAVAQLDELVTEIADGVEAEDANAVKSSIDYLKAKIQEFINAGDKATAQKYIDALKNCVESNKAKIAAISPELATAAETTVSDVVAKIAGVPAEVANEATEVAAEVANDAKAAAEAKVEETKAAAVEKANEAIDNQKAKANEAIDKAANDLKGKLGL
ncbi:MAG: hypothetical protein MJY95_00400 [Bacteroidaceae bacterium]|nr:hypothetical protein [Bacteroidaceae bacterium]